MNRLIKYFSTLNSQLSSQKGFTLIELIIVMGIFATLTGLSTISLMNVQHKSSLTATVNTLTADLRSQQLKAMVGDTEGRAAVDTYGINLATNTYTLFHGTFSSMESTNFAVNVPSTIQVTTTLPNSQIIFLKGSGEVSGFVNGSNTITLRDTVNGSQSTITVNRLGVITGVN
ncbi:MAG: type II secretion system protein [Candidatus Levybacteria bacterium]|nr:type II secretion system protein [Candidatus Levybacteria bacterium]